MFERFTVTLVSWLQIFFTFYISNNTTSKPNFGLLFFRSPSLGSGRTASAVLLVSSLLIVSLSTP